MATKTSKRMTKAREGIDANKLYTIEEAVKILKEKAAVKFDETGLNTLAKPVMVQWQEGRLRTVWPKDLATAPARWKGKTISL